MALRALFKKQEEKNKETQRKPKAPVIIDDDDDFQGSSLIKTRRNGRTAGAPPKRKRARIQDDSESEEDVEALKKLKASNKCTPNKKGSGGGAKKASTTPTKKESKKEIKSVSDFFGTAPVKRSTCSTKSDKGGEKSNEKPVHLQKQQVQDGDEGEEISTVPESPTEAIFNDEAVALALQEAEELEMQKERERQIHEDEEFSKTLCALDKPDVAGASNKKVQPSSSRPPAKKLKLMMEKVPVSRSPSKTPTSTPTKEKQKRKSPEFKATNAKGKKVSERSHQPTTSRGTRGGVRYLDDEEETNEFKVEKKKPKISPSVSPIATKQESRTSTNKSPFGQRTTPPPGKRQITPTKGKSPIKSLTTTTPKKSTPQQPAPSTAAASRGGCGTTPSLSRAQSYLRYKNRGGPRAPGSKQIPQGAENCLEGLTFVITGVLESLDRDEAADIVKKYGGKVTTSVSGRTSYIIVGEEAGVSKLAKARQVGTKEIDEDGLLDLIRMLPTPSKTAGKKTTAAAASKKTKAKSKSKSPPSMKSHDPQPATPTSSHITSTGSFYGKAPSISASVTKLSSEPQNLLWVDKYRPHSTKGIIGQQGDRSNAKKLAQWLQNWDKNHGKGGEKGGVKRPLPWGGSGGKDDGSLFKAALLSGPPGIGKTTTATLVCEESGYTYVELNASSTRNKRTLHDEVASLLSCLSLSALVKGGIASGRRHALIMDEVDGMAGNEDRGGMQELIQMIKTTKIPIICICNDRQSMKIRSLVNHCYDLRFQRPKVDQIKGAMMSVCFKEGLTIEPQALREMIIASGQDVRQVMHNLSMWSATNKKMNTEEVHKAAMNAKKNSKMSPFDVVRTVFSPMEGEREFTLNEKSDLFFHDYSMASLFVQENYVNVRPHATRGDVVATLRCVAKAADSLCDGDLVERKIRSSSNWGLLPLQAFYSSVIPGEHMKGFLGRPEFPQWLGQNSKRGKFDRSLQELQRHTRLATSCSKLEFSLDYLHHLRARLTQPLLSRGLDGVPDVVSSMEHYDLLRSDWDVVTEMAQFTGKPDSAAQIPSKVKAAFTRAFNKEGHMTHYSVASASKKAAARRSTVDSQTDSAYGDMENEGAVELEQDSDSDEELSSNPAIKVRKVSMSSQNGSRKGKHKMGSQGNGATKKKTKS